MSKPISIRRVYLEAFGIKGFIKVTKCNRIADLPDILRLDQGEMEAITLAYQLKFPLLIKETIGRQIAQNAGLKISGIAGQIIKAKREGVIGTEDAEKKLKDLFNHGRINSKIFKALISSLK